MSTWIFGIDAANPQHWDFAKREGFWDMTQNRPVRRGDLIYFWQAGGSLLGLVRATSDVIEMAPGTPMPWNLDDEKRHKYRYRFTLDVIAEDAAGEPAWSEVKERAGVTGHLGFGPRQVPRDGERWLWGQTIGADPDSTDALLDAVDDLPNLSEDRRRRISREVALRTGQARFRSRLMSAWEGRCAITGPQPARVLEAAHIQPFRGEAAHVDGNGLLLRADVHRLFDAFLLTLEPTADGIAIRSSPELAGSDYEELDGQLLSALPRDPAFHPHPDSMAAHRALSWLSEGQGTR